jgi:hypothetical protein
MEKWTKPFQISFNRYGRVIQDGSAEYDEIYAERNASGSVQIYIVKDGVTYDGGLITFGQNTITTKGDI